MVDSCILHINDLDWVIKKVPEDDPHLIDDEGKAYGVCSVNECTIYIQESGLNKQLYYKFLKHEINHAYIFSYLRSKETWNEEDVCEWMEAFAEYVIDDALWAVKKLYNYKVKWEDRHGS